MTNTNARQHSIRRALAPRKAWNSPPTLFERVLVLNCYGTLLLSAGALLSMAGLALVTEPIGPGLAATLLAFGLCAALLGWRITKRLPYRSRLFRNTIKRIERSGFSDDYFKNACGDFCTRRVTWLVLRRLDRGHRFAEIVRIFRHNPTIYLFHSSPVLQALIDDGSLVEGELNAVVSQALDETSKRR